MKPEYVLVAVVTACLTVMSVTPHQGKLKSSVLSKHGDTSRGILTGEVHGKRLLLTA